MIIKYLKNPILIFRFIINKLNFICYKTQFGKIGNGSKIGKQILITNRKRKW